MGDEAPRWLGAYGPGVPAHLDYGVATLVDQFDAAVAAHGQRPATDFLGAGTTYAELADKVSRVAEGLRRLGVGAGDRCTSGS